VSAGDLVPTLAGSIAVTPTIDATGSRSPVIHESILRAG